MFRNDWKSQLSIWIKILPAKDTVDESEFSVSWMSCSKVLVSQGLDLFLFHRKVHTRRLLKICLRFRFSSTGFLERASASNGMLLTGFIFYVKIMLLKSEAHLASLPEGFF
ncbi:hypothetical protein TNCV_1775531 [Trichonephila clavipes]|nr:hypothetical protein TNCV_1775531 [Trichonephila clavipes]